MSWTMGIDESFRTVQDIFTVCICNAFWWNCLWILLLWSKYWDKNGILKHNPIHQFSTKYQKHPIPCSYLFFPYLFCSSRLCLTFCKVLWFSKNSYHVPALPLTNQPHTKIGRKGTIGRFLTSFPSTLQGYHLLILKNIYIYTGTIRTNCMELNLKCFFYHQ